MSRNRKELQQVIEEKLIENILLELEEDNTDSNDEQENTSEIFMLGLELLIFWICWEDIEKTRKKGLLKKIREEVTTQDIIFNWLFFRLTKKPSKKLG